MNAVNGKRLSIAKRAVRSLARTSALDTPFKYPPLFRLHGKIEYKDNCTIDLQKKTITTKKWEPK